MKEMTSNAKTLKYVDVYKIGTTDTYTNNYEANKDRYGDSIWETSYRAGLYDIDNVYGWNGDWSLYPNNSYPFIYRGGYCRR